MAEFGGSEEGGFEESIKCDEKAEGKVKSPKEMEEGIKSTPTVTRDPFTILPKEIYVNIFNQLDNPMDKQNLMNAHVKFCELFKGDRVKFLFGKVIDNLQLVEKELETDKKLTSLRLVCCGWDREIQNYYQLHPKHFRYAVFDVEECRNDDPKTLKNPYANGYRLEWKYQRLDQEGGYGYVSTKRDLGSDMSEFLASHPPWKNPFLARKVDIWIYGPESPYLETEEALRTLWSQLDKLLETYGHHIWHFAFHCVYFYNWGRQTYSKILYWLRLMPELRTLRMGLAHQDCGELDEANILRIDPPEMRKLQNIHVSRFPSCVFNKLLEGMPAIENIELYGLPRLQGFQLPTRIKELALILKNTEDLKDLKRLGEFPVATKLIINLHGKVELDWIALDLSNYSCQSSWETVWTTIGEKFPALEDLCLTLPEASHDDNIIRKMIEQSLDCRLNLKNLKRLSLTSPILFCLDFIQEIKTLQELKIRWKSSIRLASLVRPFNCFEQLLRRERVQFNQDFGRMWESNIWQVLPNLRKLEICDPEKYHPGKFTGYRTDLHLYEKGKKGEEMYNKIIKN